MGGGRAGQKGGGEKKRRDSREGGRGGVKIEMSNYQMTPAVEMGMLVKVSLLAPKKTTAGCMCVPVFVCVSMCVCACSNR